jgi:acetolactate synthase-1/2/3 large subunit
MGFGVPAAVGAKAGQPDRVVIDIAGDGSFMMTCQEVASSVTEEIPVVVLVMNDYCLGMIKQLQDSFYGKRHEACRFGRNVDFARLAESMGAAGFRVSEEAEIAPTLEKALGAGRTAVVDCILDDPANVYPMVTGSSLLEYVE